MSGADRPAHPDHPDRPDRPERKRSRLRRLVRGVVFSILLLAIPLGAGWWWLETDAAADRVRRWLEDRASEGLDRRVRIASLELDVFPFHAAVDGIVIEGAPGDDAPFLTVQQADVSIRPWGLARGRLQIASVDLHRPHLHLDLAADGSTNVPRLVDDQDGDGWEVEVQEVGIDDGVVEIDHRPTSVEASLAELAAEMRPAPGGGRTGSVRFAEGSVVLDAGERPVDLQPVDLRLGFEAGPDEVRLDDLVLQVGASRVEGAGTLARWDAAHFDLRADVDLAEAVRAAGVDTPWETSGTLEFEGTLDHDGAGTRLQGALAAERAVVAGVELLDPAATLELDAGGVRVEQIDVEIFDGRLQGDVRVDPRANPTSWTVSYTGTDIDLARLTAWPGFRGIRFAGRGDARGELRWAGPVRETLAGDGEIELRVPTRSLAEVFPAARPVDTPPGPATGGPDRDRGSGTPASGQTPAMEPTPSLPLPLSASASYGLQDGVLTVRSSRASVPRTEARLAGRIDLDGGVDADLTIDSDDLRMLDRLFNQVRRFRGEEPTPRPVGLRGAGGLVVHVGGQIRQPALEGTMTASGLEVSDNRIGDLEGRLRLAGNSLQIEALEVRHGAGGARGEATFRIGGRSGEDDDYRLDVTLDRYPLELDLSRTEIPFEISGPADGEIHLSGRYGRAPVGRVEAGAPAMELNGVGPFQARLRVRLTESVWYADRVELDGEAGFIDLTGSWSRPDDTIAARLAARDVDASVLGDLLGRDLPVAGRLRAEARIEGRPAAPDATVQTSWQAARVEGVPVGDVGAAVRLSGGRAALLFIGGPAGGPSPEPPEPPPVSAAGAPPALPAPPAAGWVATGTLPLDADPVLRFRAAGSARWVPALLVARGVALPDDLSVEGGVDALGTVPLDDWQAGRIRATVADLQLQLGEVGLQAPPPIIVELRDGMLEVDVPTLLSRDGSFSASATIDIRERRWVEGEARGHLEMEVLRLLRPDLVTSGHLDGEVRASGALDDTDLEGRIELVDVTVEHPSWPYPARDVSGALRMSGDRLELVDVRGQTAGQEFDLSGVLPLRALAGDPGEAPVDLELSVSELPLTPALERSSAFNRVVTAGDVSLTARIRGHGLDWGAYGGEVTIQGLRVRFADLPVSLATETTLQVREGRVELPGAVRLTGPGTDVTVGGTVDLAPLSLDLETTGTLNLDPLNALVEEWGVAGRAEVDLRLQGRPPGLGYTGTVTVRDGLVSPPPLGQPVEDIQARFELDGRDVRVAEFRGRLGGGAVVGGGSLQLRDSTPQSFNLSASVEDALLRLEREVRLNVSAELVHEGTLERSVLSGTIFVDQGEYGRRWEPGDPILELLEDPGGGEDGPFLRSVVLDMTLEAPSGLRVANNIADLELQADLEIRGTLADPVLLGRAAVIEGDVTWQDNTFRILQGTVEFQNPVRTEPIFDVRAETSIREYIVTLNFSGSLDGQIVWTHSSSPPLSTLELIRLMALGQRPQSDGAGRDDVDLGNVGVQASNFLTAQYLNELTRGAQRVFGVDRFRIEPTIFGSSADPTARVTVGERVTRNLLVNYSTVLGQGDEQLITVEYQLTRGIRIIGTREEDGSLGLDFHFDHRF